jgi:hypothetical protein
VSKGGLEGRPSGVDTGLVALRLDPAHVTMVVEAVGLNEAAPMVSAHTNGGKN